MTITETYPGPRSSSLVPSEEYARWRAEHPLRRVRLRSGQDFWLELEYEESGFILNRTDSVTSDATAPGYPQVPGGEAAEEHLEPAHPDGPPEHAALRKRFASFSTAKRIAAWKPEIERITDQAIADFLTKGSPGDLYRDFVLIVPSQVICLLLGVDYALAGDFDRLAEANNSSLHSAEQRVAAVSELQEIVLAIFDDQHKNSRAGIVADLLRFVDAGDITHDAALWNTFLSMVGGHETTAHSIALGSLQQMENPALVQRITAEPAKIPVLVEEMLRT